MDRGLAAADPLNWIRGHIESLDFRVSGHENGRVTLEAEVYGLSRSSLVGIAAKLPATYFLVLDESTGFPIEARIVGRKKKPQMLVRFSDLERFVPGSIEDSLFTYVPAKNATVMDLADRLADRVGE